METVRCKTCGKDFECLPHFEDTKQAAGCAALLYIYDNHPHIIAHYGSQYDMNHYTMTHGDYQAGDICDECITKYIDSGIARLIEKGVW